MAYWNLPLYRHMWNVLSKCEILNCVYALHENYKMDTQIVLQCHILAVHVSNVYIYVHKCDGIFGTDTLHLNRTQNDHLKWDKNQLIITVHFDCFMLFEMCVFFFSWNKKKKTTRGKSICERKLFTKSTIGLQTPWHLSIFLFYFDFFFINFFSVLFVKYLFSISILFILLMLKKNRLSKSRKKMVFCLLSFVCVFFLFLLKKYYCY